MADGSEASAAVKLEEGGQALPSPHSTGQPSSTTPKIRISGSEQLQASAVPTVLQGPHLAALPRPAVSAQLPQAYNQPGSVPVQRASLPMQAAPGVQNQIPAPTERPSLAWPGAAGRPQAPLNPNLQWVPASTAAGGPMQGFPATSPSGMYMSYRGYPMAVTSAQLHPPPQSLPMQQHPIPTLQMRPQQVQGAPRAGGTLSSPTASGLQQYEPAVSPGGPPPAASAPLPSLSSSMAYAAASPGRTPGATPLYRVPQQVGVRGHMPQMSSQAYIQQASAQLQQSYPAYQTYAMPQGPSATPLARSYPPATSPIRAAGAPSQAPVQGAAAPPKADPSPPSTVPQGTSPSWQHQGHQGRKVPMSSPTASIPHIKRPGAPKVEWLGPTSTNHIPGIFTISDRKVRVPPGEEETTPMYALLRRWVQNDPMLPFPAQPTPEDASQPTNARPEQAAEIDNPMAVELPIMETSKTNLTRFSSEELLEVNKKHWVRVREYHMAKRLIRLEAFRQHLASLIPDPNLRSSSPPIEDSPRDREDEADRALPTGTASEADAHKAFELAVTTQATLGVAPYSVEMSRMSMTQPALVQEPMAID